MTHLALVFTLCFSAVHEILGHGMMMDPPNRSSLWRVMDNVPINYNDNQNFCGGFSVQWGIYNGKCGVCGDRYNDTHPQRNENTGVYGQGIVPRKYKSGSVIDVQIRITSNHMGTFTYSLCKLEDSKKHEPGEKCFKYLKLADGSPVYKVAKTDYEVVNKVQLPANVTCERCVLRWHYKAGNNWGFCPDGSGKLGCGPQETFRSCSDVSIQ